MKSMLLLFVSLSFAAVSYAEGDFRGDIYCETGNPSGGGPGLDLKVVERGNGIKADLLLRINSRDPQYGRANVRAQKNGVVAKNVGSGTVKTWLLPVSRAYQVRLSKEMDGKFTYWGAVVESRLGKFEPVHMYCQDVPD